MNSSWLFNLGADVYGWFTAQPAWRASCERLAEHLRLAQIGGCAVVDLGCGPGVSTFELARQLPEALLVGLDVAPRMLTQARRRRRRAGLGSARLTFLRADAASLPLGAHSVAACTGHSFLYLVADRAATLREIRRVLRPGGRVVLMEPNVRRVTVGQTLAVSRDLRHLVSVSLWRPFSRLHGRFSVGTLTATLSEAGFVDCQAEETLGGLGLLATATSPG